MLRPPRFGSASSGTRSRHRRGRNTRGVGVVHDKVRARELWGEVENKDDDGVVGAFFFAIFACNTNN